jgi:predicted outer membrane repeat protein
LILLLGSVWLAACGGNTTPPSVVKVEIEQPDQTLVVGDTVALTATVTVLGGASTAVTWSTSASDVAGVSAAGVVTAEAPGTATITATSVGKPTRTDTVSVTVVPGDSEPPTIVSFTATPTTIESGESSTLAWQITGPTAGIAITTGATTVQDELDATGDLEVTPDATAEYTLTVTPEGDGEPVVATVTVTVTVTPPPDEPAISSFTGVVATGSRAALSWTAVYATSLELFAVNPSDAEDVISLGTYAGTDTGATVALPDSAHQAFRLDATGAGGEASATLAPLANVVLNESDYEVYYLVGGGWAEPAIPGSFRYVLEAATSGSVIGFASDVQEIVVYGVDLFPLDIDHVVDSHIVIRNDVTISGPVGAPVTLRGQSAWQPGDPGEAYTYGSRVVYVPQAVTATLENLVITGGTFIYFGSGIHNAGTLTIRNSLITDNRAFGSGGGIYNVLGATLTVENSTISDNQAVTLDDEIDKEWHIRDSAAAVTFPGINGWGGGIQNEGTATLVDTVVENNSSRQSGGGIYNGGVMTISGNSSIANNRADRVADYTVQDMSDFSAGGGISNVGTLTMTGGTITMNLAADQGGGLYHFQNALTTLTGVTITNNAAGLPSATPPVVGYGGGIMQHYYDGELDHLTRTGGVLTGNTPQDILTNPNGVRPLGGASAGTVDEAAKPFGLRLEGFKLR